MFRTMLKSKIHRATVTQSDLHYVGSVTVDEDLMDAADLLPGEQIAIVDVTNGARLETYVIPGALGSGVVGINGAAAHLMQHAVPARDGAGTRRGAGRIPAGRIGVEDATADQPRPGDEQQQ